MDIVGMEGAARVTMEGGGRSPTAEAGRLNRLQ